jgi:PAS domain S-box-containing protein
MNHESLSAAPGLERPAALEPNEPAPAGVRGDLALQQLPRANGQSDIPRDFEALVEGLDAVVWQMDVDTFRFTYVSQRAEHVLGYPVRRWLEEPTFWQDVLLHPEDRDWALDFCQSARRDSRDHEFEYRAKRANGETVWLRDLVRVVRDEAGVTRQLRGVMVDVSEQKQAVEELRKREAQLAEAQALAHIGSWEVDVETDTVTWSDETYRLCGLEPQSVALSTADFLGFIHVEDRDRVRQAIERLIQQGEPYCLEARIQGADGSVRHTQMRGEAVADPRGRVIRLRGTGQDITERVRAEEALRASEESYRTIFQHSAEAIWVHDLETGEMLEVNPAGREMFGYTFAEMMAAGHDALLYPGSAYTAERVAEYMALAAAGETPRFEWMGRHKDGSAVWGEITLRRVTIGGKDRILACVRDITAHKVAGEARRRAEEDARTMASRMRAVAGAAAGVIGAESVDRLVPILYEACKEVISFDCFFLCQYDPAAHTLAFAVGYDSGEFVPPTHVPAAGTPSERVILSRRPLVTSRSSGPTAEGAISIGSGRASESIIRVPILSGDRVLGVLSVQSYTPDLYTPQDVEVLAAIASLAATALVNIELLEELRASEESYRTIFDASHDAIFIHDLETGAILDVNRRCESMHGYSREEMIALGVPGVADGTPPFDAEHAGAHLRRAAAGEPQRFEWLARHRDGSPIWVDVYLQRVSILGQDRILATTRDITERKLTEQARLEAERLAHGMASRMRAVAGAAAGVIGATSVEALQEVLREECRRVIPFNTFTMALYDPAAHTLTHLEGYDTDVWVPAATISATGTPAERVIRTRRSLVTRHADDPEAAGAVPMGTGRRSESIIRSPILSGERVLGVLSVQSYTPELYAEQDVEVLEAIASLAATALLNLELSVEREAAEEALRQANEELEQRVAERTAQLRQRTAELEAIFQALPDLYFRLTPDGTVLDYRAGDDDRVLPPEAFLGRPLPEVLDELVPEEVGATLRPAIEEVNRTGRLVCVEYPLTFHRTTGEFEARLLKLRDGSLIAVVRDITDRKQAERELQRREEHFRRLTENAHDMVAVTTLQGGITYVSPSAERILGYSPDEMLGMSTPDLIHPDDLAAAERNLSVVVSNPGLLHTSVIRHRHKDGSWRVMEVLGRTLSPTSAEEGIVVNSRDITERKQFENALQEREEWFRGLIENAHDMVQVVDAENTTLYVSPSVERILGYAPDELIGRVSPLETHPDDVQRAIYLLAETIADPGVTTRGEFRVRHRDGTWRWLEVYGRTLSPTSAKRGIVANLRDVTERKQFEEALQDSEARYRSLIENAHDLVTILDLEGRVTYQSPQLERVLGYDPVEMLGQNALDYVHPEDRGLPAEALQQIFASPAATHISEYRFRHKDGSWRYLETFGRTLVPDSPEQGLVFNSRDVTERCQAQRLLQEREEHFRKLIETSHDLIQTLDAQGNIVYTGPSVERLLGYAPEEITGKGANDFIHPDDRASVVDRIAEALTNPGKIIHLEYRVLHKDGRWRWFEAMGRTLAPDTAAHGMVANARDITERKRTEEAVRRATEEAERAREAAERANRAKSEFLSRMSHELRTPMNSILGFAQLLDRAQLAPEHKKGVSHILKAGRHLLQLINEVLEIARIEAGRHSLSLEPVRVGTVLKEAVALVRPLAAQWRVQLDDEPWPGCAVFVQADRQRLTQVLLNLLGNAIKYNRAGGRVRVSCETMSAGERQRLVVRVQDTGRGIAPDKADQLFTPFARLGAEQSEVEGTGLGLALSQRLTEAMGGSLTLESTGVEGSVFRLELQVTADPLQRLEENEDTSASLDGVPHAPATLLYIEDNLANLSLVETILLSRPHWRTMPALQGQIGVELAREHTPDLILLDLHLPDISGEEVLRRLRAEPRTATIPVVVITADATRTTVERLRTAGADAYLTKPLDIDEFLETVGRLLPSPE